MDELVIQNGGGGSNITPLAEAAAAAPTVEPLRPFVSNDVKVEAPWGGSSIFVIDTPDEDETGDE